MASLIQKFFKYITDLKAIPQEKQIKDAFEILEKDKKRLEEVLLLDGKKIIVTVPDFDKNTNKCVLVSSKFKEGDLLHKGAVIGILETKLLSMEFETFLNGKILYLVSVGTKLKVDDVLCVIED